MRRLTIHFASLCLMALAACGGRGTDGARVTAVDTVAVERLTDTAAAICPEYARGFRVRYLSDSVRLVEVSDPQREAQAVYRYALVARGAGTDGVPEGYTVVRTPVERVVCMTSLQLSNFIALNAREYVAGITSTRHLFDEGMRWRLETGATRRIGIEGNFDKESIMGMAPDVIFISPFKRGGYDALRDVGVPLVPHLGYKETTPLGQAEWVKFVGMFVGLEREANELFAGVERRYRRLCSLVADSVGVRPVVFSGELRGGNWYAVGGRSFLAQLFRDAGADYFLAGDERSGGVTLDFETVYAQAEDADYWRIVNSYEGTFSYEALRAQDSRYADFRAFRERGIVYCNMRRTPFYERMPMQPDVVLADLIRVFHPGLLTGHKPVFYELLP